MHEFTIFYWLVVAIIALAIVARRAKIPAPIFWVVGGLALSLFPGLPDFALQPEFVFVLFLPPLLYAAAWGVSWREARESTRPILLLAIGLVLFTTTIVAAVAHAFVPGFSWPAAFALGAIVSPPDSVAATAITATLRVPRRLVTVLEGESLVNDASALIAYRFAVAAAFTGSFSLWQAGLQFLIVGLGGVAFGLAAGWLFARLQTTLTRLDLAEPLIENTIFLLTPFAVYLAAEALHVSGVLAVVCAGVYMTAQSSRIISPQTKLQAYSIWELLNFVLNGVVFILIGLQLRHIVRASTALPLGQLILYGAVISLVAIVVRLVWIFPATYLPRMLFRALRERDPAPPWQLPAILGWAGMRGVVSLAAALALPVQIAPGVPFPARDAIIVITFCVIMATLIVQGLSLPLVIRLLGVSDGGKAELEEAQARLYAAHRGFERLEQLARDPQTASPESIIARLRAYYAERMHHFNVQLATLIEGVGDDGEHAAGHRLRDETLAAERAAVNELRAANLMSDEVLRRIEYDIDLNQARDE